MSESNSTAKTCTKCLCVKSTNDFVKDSTKKDGLCSSCKTCYSLYYAAIRDKKLEYKKEYRAKNAEAISAKRLIHYSNNADRERAGAIAWAKENPVKRRANQAVRRAKQSSSSGRYSKADVSNLLILQKWRCACCKCSVADKYHVDHVMPLALGGGNDRMNIQILCPLCNQQKHSKHPIDFMQRKGFLL